MCTSADFVYLGRILSTSAKVGATSDPGSIQGFVLIDRVGNHTSVRQSLLGSVARRTPAGDIVYKRTRECTLYKRSLLRLGDKL